MTKVPYNPYQSWSIADFSGGLNNKYADILIKENQCADVQNCLSLTVGKLQKRPGQAYLNAAAVGAGGVIGLYGYYYGSPTLNRKLIAVFSDGAAYYWNGSSFAGIGKTGLNTSAPTLFATCVNYMVGMNGVDAPWKYDGTTVSALANAPATGKVPVLHAEKLFCITDAGTIMWSDSFAPESWPGVNVEKFDVGDGDQLTALFSYGLNKLLVCKRRRIFYLVGTSLDDFRSACVEGKHGVVGPRAGIVIDPYFYYISDDGIFRWDDLKSVDLTSGTIPQTWANVNKAALSGAVAGYNRAYNCLWFHVPEGASTVNNMVLVFDLTSQSWWVFRGISASCMVDYDDGNAMHVYTGHATQGYVVEQNIGLSDFGAAISSYWVGKQFDGGDPVRMKKFKKVFAVDVHGLNEAVFSYRLDYGAWQSPAAATDVSDVRKYALPSAKARYFQPQFSHSVAGQDFSLAGMEILYKLKKPK